ncbi:MAG: ABC transporter substrate-binding protein [Microbacterium sp.]
MAALTTIAAGAVGCSPGGADDGSLTVAGPVPIESLDPHGALSMDAGTQLAARAIFSPLVRVTGPGEYVGELAEEWSANEDASEWTFELRDVTYSDGDSVTAHDVVASFERVLEEQGPLAGNFADYTAAASDDATVVFTSPAPDAAFLGKISSFFVAPSETDFSEPVGSGPYVVESFDAGQSLELAPNADYWGGAPELGTLTFQSIPEVASRLTALQTGEVDITWSMPDDQIGELKGNSDLTIETVPGDGVVTMWFNSSTPALEDAEVRRALWQGVNVEENVVALFPETGSPADSPVSPSVFGYSPQAPYEYDPDAAKAALDAAGFDYDTTIRLQYSQPQFAAFTQAVASDLAEIGVTVEPLEKEQGAFVEDLLALDWDMNIQQLGSQGFDAATNLGRLYTCEANRMGYCNEELDTLLAEAGGTSDQAVREAAYDDAIEIIWSDAVGMYPMFAEIPYAYRSTVEGFAPDASGIPWFDGVSMTG